MIGLQGNAPGYQATLGNPLGGSGTSQIIIGADAQQGTLLYASELFLIQIQDIYNYPSVAARIEVVTIE